LAWCAIPQFNSAGLCLHCANQVIPKSMVNVLLETGFLLVDGIYSVAPVPDPLCKAVILPAAVLASAAGGSEGEEVWEAVLPVWGRGFSSCKIKAVAWVST